MDEGLSRGKLLRLARELSQERAVLETIASRILRDAKRSNTAAEPEEMRGLLAILALDLHRWYSALESIVERIERVFSTLPTGPEWHAELLTGATLEIPEIRPAILPAATLDELRELMKFRHFLRHAYAVELDRSRLDRLTVTLANVGVPVSEAILHFERFLAAAAHALDA